MDFPESVMEEKQQVQQEEISDEKVFEQVFMQHFKALHGYAFTMLQDEAQAEEMVQNVFLRLWEQRKSLHIQLSLKAYLYRSVYNECMNYIKHQQVKRKYEERTAYQLRNESGQPAERMQLTELEKQLAQALNLLPEKCRTVFQLSRFENLKYQQIADKLGISIKTVENQMGKALRILRLELADYLLLIILLLTLTA